MTNKTKAPEWTEDDVQSIVCNPIYAGIGPYPQIIGDEAWIKAASKLVTAIGPEAFLAGMLRSLRASFEATAPTPSGG